MKKDVPVVFKKIHTMLLKRALPDGKIDRQRLFEIISERVGKLGDQERNVLVHELKACGIILEQDKFSFLLCKECS